MGQTAHAARGDHRQVHSITDGPGQGQVKARFGAIAVHAGEQDLTGTILGHLAGPGDSVQAGVGTAPVAVDVPARAACQQLVANPLLGINRHHDALGAVALRGLLYELRAIDGGGVETGLVGTGIEQAPHIVDRAHTATHGQGDEYLGGHRLDDVQNQVASVAGGGDVEKGEFVRPLGVVAGRDFYRIASVAQIDKINPLDDPPASHVQAGNDALGQHALTPRPTGLGAH